MLCHSLLIFNAKSMLSLYILAVKLDDYAGKQGKAFFRLKARVYADIIISI